MKHLEIVKKSFLWFFVILVLVMVHCILMPYLKKPKVIEPSGPGTCDVSCCIELIGNSDLAFDIKNSRLEIK